MFLRRLPCYVLIFQLNTCCKVVLFLPKLYQNRKLLFYLLIKFIISHKVLPKPYLI